MHEIIVFPEGMLSLGGSNYRCALGENGLTEDKKEGDKKTPTGIFPLRSVYFRSDRIAQPITGLPTVPLHPIDGWCDDVTRVEYNTKIVLPFEGRHELLWRDDTLYDIVVVLGYNDDPVVAGKGSAIFMHIAKPEYAPTQGCIALTKQDLLEILRHCTCDTIIRITA